MCIRDRAVTPSARAATRPTSSCPGTIGVKVGTAWPVALHHVQVGAADPAGANPDKHLPRTRLGLADVGETERVLVERAKGVQQDCFHGGVPLVYGVGRKRWITNWG